MSSGSDVGGEGSSSSGVGGSVIDRVAVVMAVVYQRVVCTCLNLFIDLKRIDFIRFLFYVLIIKRQLNCQIGNNILLKR